MSPQPLSSVAIIGAGLSSLSLTLSLLHHDIISPSSTTIYEARSSTEYTHSPENASGVILTPNGLRILDKLGVLEKVREKCWTSEYRTFVGKDGQVTRKVKVAGEDVYGYRNHRLWRRVLLEALKEMVVEKGVEIKFRKRFEGVEVEDHGKVAFLVSGETQEADMLVGADGIYSRVRGYIEPGAGPEYLGIFGVLGHVRYQEVDWPPGFGEKQFTIQDAPGSVFMIPEDRDGREGMVGLQKEMKGLTRAQWEEMSGDKERLAAFYEEKYDEWSDMAKNIIDAVCRNRERLYAWPFLRMPKLKRWYSEQGRVVCVGDAAHAVSTYPRLNVFTLEPGICTQPRSPSKSSETWLMHEQMPPSSGQGVNQALEDAWTLTILLASGKEVTQCLNFWQEMRQSRIDDVLEKGMGKANVQRLPERERERLMNQGKVKEEVDSGRFDDMTWLFKPDLEERIQEWVQRTR